MTEDSKTETQGERSSSTVLLGVDRDVTLLEIIKAPCGQIVDTINALRADKARLDALDQKAYYDENGECGWCVPRYNRGDLRYEADILISPNA